MADYVTNVIILEFLSARFVYPGALRLAILYNILTRENIRITKANKLLKTFVFDYNDVRAFKYLNKQLDIFLNEKQPK